VCQTAVDVDADASKFPDDWLFPHRWGKGKKASANPLLLPGGEKAKIKFIKVGGRTSAIVEQVQKLTASAPGENNKKRTRSGNVKETVAEDASDASSELTELSDEEGPSNTRSKRSPAKSKPVQKHQPKVVSASKSGRPQRNKSAKASEE